MKLIEKYDKVKFLGLVNDSPVLWYADHVEIERNTIPIPDNADLGNMDGIVDGKIGGKELVFQNGEFTDWPPIRYKDRIYGTLCSSQEYDGENYRLSYEYKGKEFLFETRTNERLFLKVKIFLSNKSEDVIMFTSNREKKYLFYSKTGEFLWQYTEEDANLKINWKCIPVVDDVVVIISKYGARPKKIQGFNIRTGEQIWIIQSDAKYEPDTFHVGEDNMLYGCRGYVVSPGIGITKLNPFTGDLEVTLVNKEEVFDSMPWNVTMHGRRLYYADNREGKEIGVIDVDRKEIVERQPLEIKKNVTIGAPVVTDDRMYVYIRELNELRVYEL